MQIVKRTLGRTGGVNLRLVLLFVLAAVDVWARAGGGGGYSGGGGGGFGGGGGGGGGGALGVYLVFQLVRVWILFCMQYPLVGLPLTVIVGGALLYGAHKGGRSAQTFHQARTISRGRTRQAESARGNAIARLTERDPGFSEEAFLGRVQTAFLKIQDAWCQHKLGDVRAFVSDGIHERFSLQIQEQQEEGVRDHMERIAFEDLRIVQVESDRIFDTVTVAISATAVDYEVNAATGKHVSGSLEPASFTEYWSFIRRPGAETLTAGGLIEGNCPNCGASLHLNEAAKCGSCGALIQSGEYDWVLAEITQACEWQAQAAAEVPGVDALVADDPGFSVQHLEDRASVMFWRLIASWRAGKTDAIRKMATDSFCEDFAGICAPAADGTRSFPTDCAVGAVQAVGVIRNEPMDTALVEIRWSGGQNERAADGKQRSTAASSVKTDIFMLVRGHEVKTDVSLALSSAHCPGCGAPADTDTAATCQYCGAVLNRGDHDWVLADRRPPFDQEIMALRQQLGAPAGGPRLAAAAPALGVATGPTRGNLELTAWLVTVMLADGTVDDEELEMIHAYGAERGIPRERVERIVAAVKAGQLEAPVPESVEEGRAWLEDMAAMALADGFIADAERKALMTLGAEIGLSAYDVNQIVRSKRRDLYQAAKQNLRDLRKQA